ncbi:MAG: hypothetical protein JW974_00500 [Alphaproteobacteria bacterium]|nr:hypothetical protein [Alphaproteobacteria bacterium]MBN2675229.1 hypothetical protein [Alphaproteobacteria bacterium]
MSNRLKLYDAATQKLVKQAENYKFSKFGKYSFPDIVYSLRESFKKEQTHIKIFGAYIVGENDSFSEGFCMVSSYYLYENTGRGSNWKIMRDPDHWWLVDKITNKPFDITYCQFPYDFDYKYGVPEQSIGEDKKFAKYIQEQAFILGKCADL